MFGLIPAYGFFIRHARGIELHNVGVSFLQDDRRPAFVLHDVKAADFQHVKSRKLDGVPAFVLMDVEDFRLDDTAIPRAARKEM
jgi:hypothetical protein